jgi:uroporphyrinogen-III synthase
MIILVTRPQPDNDSTTALLRARGYQVLAAPMLRFEPVPFRDDADAQYGAVIVTSANALRAIAGQPGLGQLLQLPLYAVGARTAEAAREIGFGDVISADGDANALRDLLVASVKIGTLQTRQTLLYLAGADLARDIAGELGAHGFNMVTQTTYRMAPVTKFPAKVDAAFADGRIGAVLHYSRRSARAFIDAARLAGVEISALGATHCCFSETVASEMRDAGAARVMVAAAPNETALFDLLGRAIGPLSR